MSRSITASEILDAVAHVEVDLSSAQMKKELLGLVIRWLDDNGYNAASWALREEGGLHDREGEQRRKYTHNIAEAIVRGNWDLVHNLLAKSFFRSNKTFQYAVVRQQYLEIIESRDAQKALTFLLRRIKPLEQFAPSDEFRTLCYLLTCRSVHEASSFSSWGESKGRQALVDEYMMPLLRQHYNEALWLRGNALRGNEIGSDPLTLEALIHQACTYQVLAQENNQFKHPVRIRSILSSYTKPEVPSHLIKTWRGTLDAVDSTKSVPSFVTCATFCGPYDRFVVSADEHGWLYAWETSRLVSSVGSSCKEMEEEFSEETKSSSSFVNKRSDSISQGVSTEQEILTQSKERSTNCIQTSSRGLRPDFLTQMEGFRGRVWKLSTFRNRSAWASEDHRALSSMPTEETQSLVAAACSDGAVRLWQLGRSASSNRSFESTKLETFTSRKEGSNTVHCYRHHTGDVYTCALFAQRYVVTGGYDRLTKIVDITTGTELRSFEGHTCSVSCVVPNAVGTMVASASKDGKVRFFDLQSGACVHTLTDPIPGVALSCVAYAPSGDLFATSSKNSTIRLWDLSMMRPICKRLQGHTNIQRNFIEICYGSENTLFSGSEDGHVYTWNSEGALLGPLTHGYGLTIPSLAWSMHHNSLLTCASDGSLRMWN